MTGSGRLGSSTSWCRSDGPGPVNAADDRRAWLEALTGLIGRHPVAQSQEVLTGQSQEVLTGFEDVRIAFGVDAVLPLLAEHHQQAVCDQVTLRPGIAWLQDRGPSVQSPRPQRAAGPRAVAPRDNGDMGWQQQTADRIRDALADRATVRVYGSAADPATLDGWSDLDLRLDLTAAVPFGDLLSDVSIWAHQNTDAGDRQVCRLVLHDGRRLDLSVHGSGRVVGLPAGPDAAIDSAETEIRFLAALAVTKLGRGDRLIGGHLTYEILRHCLVRAMLLRDRDEQTSVHRAGTDRDAAADQVRAIAAAPLTVTPRPGPVEQAVQLYGNWRAELEPSYRPDWSGLDAVISRGLGTG